VSFYVTTPIYYVNAAPHLGHAYTTIAADVLARHMRQRDEEVFFLTGTDEHGEPVALAAEREGVSPQELADRNALRFQELLPRLGVSNDFFIRTSDPRHERRVQELLSRVRDNGHVYEGTYEGWYCPRCADFKTEGEIGPDSTCLIHFIPLAREREDNYFFRLSTFQEALERLYTERPDFVLPEHRYNEARSFIASGLQDVSLTRAKLGWGVRVPWDESQVFYVWFDALLNYVTALSFAHEGEDLLERFWPADFHLIGKDILKFHAVFWPALLMAAELPLPRHLFIHGFLLSPPPDTDASGGDAEATGGTLEKMSKSRGNVIDPFAIVQTFGADALRYYLFREVSFGQDGPVSEAGFATRYETELANEYGNLASRTIAMVHRYRDGVVPEVDADPALSEEFAGLSDRVAALLDRADLTAALEVIWQHVRRLNRYVEEQAPWRLAREEARAGELDSVLVSLVEGLRVVSVLLCPYLPQSAPRLLEALGQPDQALARAHFRDRGSGQRVETLPPLFPKL
jgi:methionyl-tRNA synthetase